MEQFMYGRQTTLAYLTARRDNPAKSRFVRIQADRAIKNIMRQMRDRQLMHLRERLINAARHRDDRAQWKIENEIRAYERKFEHIEKTHYTARSEDS